MRKIKNIVYCCINFGESPVYLLVMKRTLIIFVLSLLSYTKTYSQQWHSHTDTLKSPLNNSHYQIAVGFFNRLDTVECRYKLLGENSTLNGFKLVYVFEGYFIDTQNTIDVFFNDKKQRVYSVMEYALN